MNRRLGVRERSSPHREIVSFGSGERAVGWVDQSEDVEVELFRVMGRGPVAHIRVHHAARHLRHHYVVGGAVSAAVAALESRRQLMYFKWIKKYFKIGNDKATCTRLFFPENRQAGAGGGLGLFLDQNLLRSSEARRLRRSSPVRACSWQRR